MGLNSKVGSYGFCADVRGELGCVCACYFYQCGCQYCAGLAGVIWVHSFFLCVLEHFKQPCSHLCVNTFKEFTRETILAWYFCGNLVLQKLLKNFFHGSVFKFLVFSSYNLYLFSRKSFLLSLTSLRSISTLWPLRLLLSSLVLLCRLVLKRGLPSTCRSAVCYHDVIAVTWRSRPIASHGWSVLFLRPPPGADGVGSALEFVLFNVKSLRQSQLGSSRHAHIQKKLSFIVWLTWTNCLTWDRREAFIVDCISWL